MITYLIIGVIIFTLTTISQVINRDRTIWSMLGNLHWWVATAFCVITWPVIVLWAVHDAIKELKEEGLA